jgi:hypothetical protein
MRNRVELPACTHGESHWRWGKSVVLTNAKVIITPNRTFIGERSGLFIKTVHYSWEKAIFYQLRTLVKCWSLTSDQPLLMEAAREETLTKTPF